MNIHIGSWAFPLLFTIAAFLCARAKTREKSVGDYSGIGEGIGFLVYNGLALILSLVAWLAWALLR
jgi:hypothetical protein